MARVALNKPERIEDPVIEAIFSWVTRMEGAVPNHFYAELNFPEYLKAKLGSTKVLWEEGELSIQEVLHVGIAVSRANDCEYCTAAFCTELNYGLGEDEEYVKGFLVQGAETARDERTKAIVRFALKVNRDPAAVTDQDIQGLRDLGLTDRGIVQLVHLVSDFASYNRFTTALAIDYDYRDLWREVGFGWKPGPTAPSATTPTG